MTYQLLSIQPAKAQGQLELSPITLNPEYKEKWNTTLSDFYCLTRNGEPIRDTLYRIGGMGRLNKDGYSMLLKQTEGIYKDNITKDPKKKRYLKNLSCIIDKNGVEKVVFHEYESPYLVKNSCLYKMGGYYYNIETGYLYCYASNVVESEEFLWVENKYDKDESRRGVMQINKKDGTFKLFK